MNKFKKLIEFVIEGREDEARSLFHDIVVEKSRSIYEDLMNEEDEDSVDIEADEAGDGDDSEEIDFDSDSDGDEDSDDVEIDFDDEDSDDDSDEGDLEDRVVDLEDQLDELMAEFESLMSGNEADDMGDDFGDDMDGDVGGDALEVDDTEEFGDDDFGGLNENIDLVAVPKVSNSEESWVNTRSTNADNSGAVGAVAKPVSTTGAKAEGRSDPKVGDLPDAGSFKNVPAKDGSKLSPAPKPVTSQASGTNTVTPFPKV